MINKDRWADNKKGMWNYLKMKIHTSDMWKDVFRDDRAAYETMLHDRYGNKKRKVMSCKELTLNELFDLVKYMTGLENSGVNKDHAAMAASFKQVKFMTDLWRNKARNVSDKALLAFIKRQTGKEYMNVSSVLRTDMRKILPALQAMNN